jgi:hypothetical protein
MICWAIMFFANLFEKIFTAAKVPAMTRAANPETHWWTQEESWVTHEKIVTMRVAPRSPPSKNRRPR